MIEALDKKISRQEAYEVQSNGDILELMKAEHLKELGVVVLLFHRASPFAADPIYRKKAPNAVTLRSPKRDAGEHQAISAHLVIELDPIDTNKYKAVLEEIPGMGMGVLKPILTQALKAYEYDYVDRRGQKQSTYCVCKAEGVRSESLESALRKGHLDIITLVRQAEADFVDAEGIFVPLVETMKLRISPNIDHGTWMKQVGRLVTGAKKRGWTDFKVEIDLGNERSKTVALDREQEAKEVLFVSSERSTFDQVELMPCSLEVVPEIVAAAKELLQMASP